MKQSQNKSVNNNNNSLFYRFSLGLQAQFLAAACMLIILFFYRYNGILNINRYYLGSMQGDAGLYLWLLKTNLNDLFSLQWFDKLAFYPYSKVLAWSDNFIFPSILAKLLFILGLSDQFVFNFLVLTATFLNGYFTFMLCLHISGEALASFFAGCIFMTLPYFTHQLGHPQLEFFFFIPLAIDRLILYINYPTLKNSFILGIIISCAFLTTVAYSIFIVLICAIILINLSLLKSKRINKLHIKRLCYSGLLFFILLLPFILPYFYVKDAFGERQIYEAYYFSAKLFSYISATPFNLLYSSTQTLTHSEAHLLPGISIFILAIFAISRIGEASKLKKFLLLFLVNILFVLTLSLLPLDNTLRITISLLLWLSILQSLHIIYVLGALEKKLYVSSITSRDLTAIFAVISLIFFIISLGPLANPTKNQLAFTPYTFFYHIVPGFSSIRAISRAGIVVLFCLCVLSSIYFSVIFKKKATKGVALIVLFFALLENYNTDYPLSTIPSAPDNIRTLQNIDSRQASVFLPFAGELDSNSEVKSWSEYAKINMTYLLWSTEISKPLLNGYSGQKTKIMREFPRELKDFPSQRALNALGRVAGLKYVLYVPDFDSEFSKVDFEKKASSFASQIKLISSDTQGTYLFEIRPELQSSLEKPILLPANRFSKLDFEIRTTYREDITKRKVNVLLNGINNNTSFEIEADGSWNKHTIDLPRVKLKVPPILLAFESEDESKFIIRNPTPQ